jgi:hypothetical protein
MFLRYRPPTPNSTAKTFSSRITAWPQALHGIAVPLLRR